MEHCRWGRHSNCWLTTGLRGFSGRADSSVVGAVIGWHSLPILLFVAAYQAPRAGGLEILDAAAG